MTVARETREKINNEMADKVRDAIVRYCDDAEAVRAWFDDIMVLVWGRRNGRFHGTCSRAWRNGRT